MFEPRHATWFGNAATTLLVAHRVARVAADPACAPGGDEPAAWPGAAYYRLHGSPQVYYSEYDSLFLDKLAERLSLSATRSETWCIFDNTARGHATTNAMRLCDTLGVTR